MCRTADALRRLVVLLVVAALAPAARPASETAPAKRHFDLPAGDAATTLRAYTEQSGEQIVYVVPRVQGVKTNPVKGEFTVREAIDRMLAKTALTVVADAASGALLIQRLPLPAGQEARSAPGPSAAQPTPMKKTLAAGLVAVFASLTATDLAAQTVPASNGTQANEAVVQLSPFAVNSTADVGYRAANTLAGSRLNSSLKDTPAVLDVLTKEFLDDVGATTLEQALNFSTNYETSYGDLSGSSIITSAFPGANQGLNFNTRGQGGGLARNFLATSFRPEFYTIERIDNSSGPNAILFGLGSAGGVANVSTKQAKLSRNAYDFEFQYNSNNGRRATLDLNQVLIRDRLALRVNGIANRGRSYRKYTNDELDGVQIAATWRVGKTTKIRAEYELDHTTGLVVLPTTINEKVSQWLAAGSRTITVPADWDTLTNANRTAQFNTYTASGIGGINLNSTTDLPIFVTGAQSYMLNARNALVSVGTTTPVTNNALVPYDVNFSGPGGRKQIDRQLLALSIDQRLAEKLYFNLSASREGGPADTYQTFPGTGGGASALTADPNATINNAGQFVNLGGGSFTRNAAGQILNPRAGQLYFDGRWRHRVQDSTRETIQASLAWQYDGRRWWGAHNLVSNLSYSTSEGEAQQYDEQWLGAPFNNTVSNVNNAVIRRNYVTPGDSGTYHSADWINSQNLTWQHPTRGLLTTGWVPIDSTRQNFRNRSALGAVQSFFFKRRLVTTFGYRYDEQTSYQYLSRLVKPPGYENSNGYPIIDGNSTVSQTVATGGTKTFGAVYHLTDWISLYGNKSTSFSPAGGNRFGPDGLTGPTQKGQGLDAGLKFNLFENKVSLDLGYFDTSTIDAFERLNIQLRTSDSVFGAWGPIFSTLNAPLGAPQLLNTSSQSALDELKASYPALRPVWLSDADLLDKASKGYEARFVANPMTGLRLRATYSYTDASKEDLLKNTLVARDQLRLYIAELKSKNPAVNVGNLTTTAGGTTIDQNLALLDTYIQEAIDFNTNAFGSSKHRFNFFGSYDFPGRLKGWSSGLGMSYKSGSVVSSYQIIDPAKPRILLQEIPIYGVSTTDWSAMLRYSTRAPWLNRRGKFTVQLNVTNLLDKSGPFVRRYNTITVAPGTPLPAPTTPTSLFLRAPRSFNLSVKLGL
ncbi:MAG: hypothetical protein Q8N18_18610 [Opitutaceae bacterium]|nr:hypothetical protein [Opitutaceae bacterium]